MASFKSPLAVVLLLVIVFTDEEAFAKEDCELHRPTIQDFCCDVYEEDLEFMDCLSEWSDKLEFPQSRRDEMVFHFCIAECTYNETEYLKDETSLDLRIIKNHLNENYADEADAKLMLSTFKKCEKHARDMLQNEEILSLKKRLKKAGCKPYAGLVMECVSNELILRCPEDKWNDSAQCDHAREFLQNCMK